MFKKKLAVILATALVATTIPTAFLASEALPWNTNGGEETVEGENYGVEPIIEVELPGDLEFGINPLYLDADEDGNVDPQIVTAQYQITNYSNVDILVEAVTTAEAGEEAEPINFMQTKKLDATTGELEATTAARNIYLVQMLPKAPTTITEEANILNMNEFDLATTTEANIGGYVLGSDAAKVLFKLDTFVATDAALELKPANVSGFTFAGAVDPNSTFYQGDVYVKTVFTLTTLSEKQSSEAYEALDNNGATYDTTVVQEVAP